MKKLKMIVVLVLIALLQSNGLVAQNEEPLNLKNVLVVAQQENVSDRYSLEVALIQLFSKYDIKTKAALNVIKQEGSADILLKDSTKQALAEEGIDTYLLVSIRGYDSRFRPSEKLNSLEDEIKAGHLFPLYREGATRVTFTFTFYRNSIPVHYELIRTGTIGSKDAVIKKLLKKVEKQLLKEWL